jgi:SAM-dependent methyltransferase
MAESSTVLYDDIASWYIRFARDPAGLPAKIRGEILRIIAKDTAYAKVCDLACGEGTMARMLAMNGAHVTGVDISKELLDAARKLCADKLGSIQFILSDIADIPKTFRPGAYDGVVCSLALMDIQELASALGSVRWLLRDNGWFVAAITHPCFQTPSSWWDTDNGLGRNVRAYFAEGWWICDGKNGVRSRVGSYHRTLSTYINCMLSQGLQVSSLNEPIIEGVYPGYLEVPPCLLIRCTAVDR